MDEFKKLIREVPDFPKAGILFYDITTLLKDKVGFRKVIDALSEQVSSHKPDLILGIEARGFIFAPALAYNLGAGFVPEIVDRALIDKIIEVSDVAAERMARRLAREEGLLVGPSSGANVHAALEAANELTGNVVTILCDSGERYLF